MRKQELEQQQQQAGSVAKPRPPAPQQRMQVMVAEEVFRVLLFQVFLLMATAVKIVPYVGESVCHLRASAGGNCCQDCTIL